MYMSPGSFPINGILSPKKKNDPRSNNNTPKIISILPNC